VLGILITHAGIAAGVFGRSVTSVCLYVRALTGKWLELSTPNVVHVHVHSVAVTWHALIQRSKGKGHTVTKTVTVAQLLVAHAAMAYASVGMNVDSTAYVF